MFHNNEEGIRAVVLEKLVLSHVQMVTSSVLYHEEYFRKTMSELRQMQSKEELLGLQKQLERNEKRIDKMGVFLFLFQ